MTKESNPIKELVGLESDIAFYKRKIRQANRTIKGDWGSNPFVERRLTSWKLKIKKLRQKKQELESKL